MNFSIIINISRELFSSPVPVLCSPLFCDVLLCSVLCSPLFCDVLLCSVLCSPLFCDVLLCSCVVFSCSYVVFSSVL